ncbi:hypothetical protein KTQ36_05940 [Sphingomicrobium sp. B8]|uniref:Lipoprotein n=1 Tax=Sphingomicrobium clamense TaxID=2851013 RepID=A0ABS6V5S3_9SPHN|nr:hypothetical protein [Sphingomicrobium sp. B8]MBW0144836.1 hypothetical protein [Sphingomicrobium sp. B8]
MALSACSTGGQLDSLGGVYSERSLCPQLGIPAGTGDVTLFHPGGVAADYLDVTATITNLRSECYESGGQLISVATYDVVAQRRAAGPPRAVSLPVYNVAMQGGSNVVAKRVAPVTVNFENGQLMGQATGTATIRVDRAAVTLPDNVRAELTRKRKAGEVDAAIDPLTVPAIRDAVSRATFEHLVGFQLTQDQLRYNATR